MPDITFRSDMTVDLIDSMGNDDSVIRAAKVSTMTDATVDEMSDAGKGKFIDFLVSNRHGCYDADTDVLTKAGWKNWTEVSDTDIFATLNLSTNTVQYQPASRIVRAAYTGDMIQVENQHMSLLVTPNHKMVVQPHINGGYGELQLVDAAHMSERSYRFSTTSEGAGGAEGDVEFAWLLGFAIADGTMTSSPEFHLKKERKIQALFATPFEVRSSGNKYRVVGLTDDQKALLREATDTRAGRRVPRLVLETWGHDALCALLEGYLTGDGHTSTSGKVSFSTIHRSLMDSLQELAVRIGINIGEGWTNPVGGGYSNGKPLYTGVVYRAKYASPRIGWTTELRTQQVQTVAYSGVVYCATVPNGTLMVRRKGKMVWSGNSPFEHVVFTFRIEAPIFVWREFMRHRMASYNEESGRYTELKPVFYIPDENRNLVQVGKPGEYAFTQGDPLQVRATDAILRTCSVEADADYRSLLKRGIAREVARMVLPLNIYSTAYVTMNLRSLTNFLSLRRNVEGQTVPSFPQREIEMVAELMEQHADSVAPITLDAFRRNGRVGL